MTDKNKKMIVKMAAIIKQQQALINKLAQFAPGTKGDPLADFDGKPLDTRSQAEIAAEAKAKADAARAAAAKAAPKPAAPKPAPAAAPTTTPWAKVDTTGYWDAPKPSPTRDTTSFTRENVRQPVSMTRGPDNKPMDMNQADAEPFMPAPQAQADLDALPADIVSALDSTVQGAKGFLRLDVDAAKNITARYNSSAIKAGNKVVQDVLTKALGPLGYKIVAVFGETNVVPNYKN